MKLLILSISLLSITSCTKDWECCVESTVIHTDSMYISLNNTTTYCVDFVGTNDEKDEFEASGTQTTNETFPDDYSISLVTVCTPD